MSSPLIILTHILQQTPNHPSIKQTLAYIVQTRQKIVYHGILQSPHKYLELRAYANHDEDIFNYIGRIVQSRIAGICERISDEQIELKDLQKVRKIEEEERIREENQEERRKLMEVQYALNNMELPTSLIKKNDKYWYEDNPKTIEAKNFVQEKIKQQRERKRKMKEQARKKQQQRLKKQQQKMEQQNKMTEQTRKMYREEVKSKIEALKRSKQLRQRSISQSERYAASLKPLFQKLQQQSQQQKLSALEEQKRRLNELRKLHKSIDYSQIEQHKRKLLEIQKQREIKKIFNEPLKVSFKSKYHTSMTTRSRIGEYQTSKSLYERKKQYASIIQKQFKPKIDETLAEQMQERLKILRRKRVRKDPNKKKKNKRKNNDDQDDDQQEESEQEPIRKFAKDQDDDDDYDSDDSSRPRKRKRGQDEDPDRQQRYEMGVQYLEYMRNLKKKKPQPSENDQKPQSQLDFYKSQTSKNSSRYKDYLKQFAKTNRRTIDYIDTSRISKSLTAKEDKFSKIQRIENQTRMLEDKIQKEEQLLKYKKVTGEQKINKKVQIDHAVIETIKARLALMGGS